MNRHNVYIHRFADIVKFQTYANFAYIHSMQGHFGWEKTRCSHSLRINNRSAPRPKHSPGLHTTHALSLLALL